MFSHRSSVGNAKGLREISIDDLNADDHIQRTGMRNTSRKRIRTTY
jgi:hypothetical protein